MKTRFVTAGLVTALLGAGGMTIQHAAAGTAPAAAFEYSIKYVCGDFAKGLDPNPPEDPEGPVKPAGRLVAGALAAGGVGPAPQRIEHRSFP